MALKLLFIKHEVDNTHVCNTHACVGREWLGARSFLYLTDRNFGAVFWQCFLFFFLRRQYFQSKIILLKFFGPRLQFPCESNFLFRVMVWDSNFTQNVTERNKCAK